MLVVLSVAPSEFDRAKQLLEWIRDLDGRMPKHRLVILGTFYLDMKELTELQRVANQAFSEVTLVKQNVPAEGGWPRRGNALFKATCDWIKATQSKAPAPWLWLECDCVPMRAGWLDALEQDYQSGGQAFMGTIYDMPFPHINGVMVYPHDPILIARWMFANPMIAWDLAEAKTVMARGYNTPLIHRSLKDPKTNTPHTFPKAEDLAVVRPEAVLFHGCKDGSLINTLRGREHLVEAPKAKDGLVGAAAKLVRRLVNGETYYHSGNLGDVVYALNAIRLAGGGGLTIGRQQSGTSPCSMPITDAQFEKFRPLLAVQPYLKSVGYAKTYPEDIVDLNRFRDDWNNGPLRKETGIHNLCQMHCHTLGVADKFRPYETWLTIPNPIRTGKIAIHRSARYHAQNFPWADVVKRYGDRLLFIGTAEEYSEFQREFGQVSFWRVKDLLELAQVIAGADAFIGNQSFPCSVALGYGQTVWQEAWFNKSADCLFERENFFTQRNRVEEFETWL